ncbi:MAG TPA: PIN domain-containing protein [Thermoprotei archaeon]|nr:PIN domain-containing protein [Thermoprotei archaeon]
MRFIDSSVFLHAFLKPRRRLSPREATIKAEAKRIIKRIDEEEENVATTVVHLSEVVNIIEARHGLQKSLSFLARILKLENVEVLGVTARDYEKALIFSEKYYVSINDALAYVKMVGSGVNEIYTFDRHFKNIPGIIILPKV